MLSPSERPRRLFCPISTRGCWSPAHPALQPWEFGISSVSQSGSSGSDEPAIKWAHPRAGGARSAAPLPSPAPPELRQRFLGENPRSLGVFGKAEADTPPLSLLPFITRLQTLGTDFCDSAREESTALSCLFCGGGIAEKFGGLRPFFSLFFPLSFFALLVGLR